MSNIYQSIYDADLAEGSGVPAFPASTSTSSLPEGYVLVSESFDANADQLIPSVSIPTAKQRSYDLARALFDNYNLLSSVVDEITVEESAEIDQLLDYVVDRAPMQLARRYIERQRRRDMSDSAWYAMVKETWFRDFRIGRSPTRSGFEHVFLGEWKSGGSTIGGLHWWYYYVIQGSKIDYDGAVYRVSDPESGLLIPEIATMTFTWNVQGRTLSKSIGGFLVGVSVEGLMAMGMVRAADVGAPNVAVLQGAEIDFRMFKSPDGRSIDTFYPAFLRAVLSTRVTEPDAPSGTPNNVNGATGGIGTDEIEPIRIIGVVANPAGEDSGHEKVTLMHIGGGAQGSVSLRNWKVVGPNNSEAVLGDIELFSGEARTFTIPESGGLQLSNKGGTISLLNARGTTVQTSSYSREDARVQGGVLRWDGDNRLVLA